MIKDKKTITFLLMICLSAFTIGIISGYILDRTKKSPPTSKKSINTNKPKLVLSKKINKQDLKSLNLLSKQSIKIPTRYLHKKYPELIFYKIRTKQKAIALTFDDGPDGTSTIKVLNILKKYNVKANFFFIGRKLQRYGSIVKRADKEGHLVLSHSWDHRNLTKLTPFNIRSEILTTQKRIKQITGKTPLFIRPPFGSFNAKTLYEALKLNSRLVLWNIDTKDYKTSTTENEIINTVLRGAKPGNIILMHTVKHNSETIKALPIIIEKLKSKGFVFETLDELFNTPAYN